MPHVAWCFQCRSVWWNRMFCNPRWQMKPQGRNSQSPMLSLFTSTWWSPERVGVKLHRQEEGGVTKEKLVGIPARWLDVIVPFNGGADEERMSPLITVKAAQQGTCAQGQQQPLSHTRLCFINSAWWETPPHSSVSLRMDRDDKKQSWKGQTERLDMFKTTIRMLDRRCLAMQPGF